MKKSEVNSAISALNKAKVTTKVTPWFFEERGGEKVEVRYVGLKLDAEWDEIFSRNNLLLLSFVFTKQFQNLDVSLANSTPFVKIMSFNLDEVSKIDVLLGDLRRRLKQDKQTFLHHQDQVGNLYKKIVDKLKK